MLFYVLIIKDENKNNSSYFLNWLDLEVQPDERKD